MKKHVFFNVKRLLLSDPVQEVSFDNGQRQTTGGEEDLFQVQNKKTGVLSGDARGCRKHA